MIKLSWGQTTVLAVASLPMAAVGVAGAVATYVNMDNVLHRGASALGLVAAGEGATLICALVALAVTLMGQHTPATVRLGMWLVPLAASGVGIALAPSRAEAVVMAFTPLAMTAAGEGVAFVARRVVAYRTGVDIEQQRRSGLLLWHANRAANGGKIGSKLSRLAVWRLTRKFAETDTQLSVQLGEIQRFRIQEGADANLAAVLTGPAKTPEAAYNAPARFGLGSGAKKAIEAAETPATASQWCDPVETMAAGMAEQIGYADEYWTGAEDDAPAEPTPVLYTVADIAVMKGVKPGTVRSWFHRYEQSGGRTGLRKVIVDGKPYARAEDVAAMN